MQCAVLVGGLGTRLGALVEDCPKPMLAVNGRPFLEYAIENAARFGFDDFVLLAGYRADDLRRHFAHAAIARRLSITIRVVAESGPMGTAGALRNAAEHLDREFLLLNGDSFFDFNLLDLKAFAVEEPWLARLALREIADASRYGVVSLAAGTRIADMRERPEGSGPGLINGGAYWVRKEMLDAIPAGQVSLERSILPPLAGQGLLRGKIYKGYFLDIGTPGDYHEADRLMANALRRPAIFFDRDGVLNHDSGYTHSPDHFRWIEDACEAVKLVNDAGWYAFVVTNQAGVARGLYDEEAVNALHRRMNEDLRMSGAHIDSFRYCPHHPEGTVKRYAKVCSWRKPAPGMLIDLMEKWPVDRTRSVMIGDKESDLKAAEAAGVKSVAFDGVNLSATLQDALKKSLTAYRSGAGLAD